MTRKQYAAAAMLLAAVPAVAGMTTSQGTAAPGTSTRAPGVAPQQRPVPSGFRVQDIPTGQEAGNLTDFGYLPGGGVLTTGRDGRVTWVPRSGSPRTIRTLSTDTSGALGLVGIGIARNYRKTHHVYLIRSMPTGSAPPYPIRLSRFTVRGGSTPTGLGHEKVLFKVKARKATHGMTTVLPARDGTLWVSIGDLRTFDKVTPSAFKAMKVGNPAGKLLHVRANGAGVRSNPFFRAAHPSSWRSRTYASGFRSPFRFSLQPGTGRPIVGEVGWHTWEEVDVVRRGGNYKWPCWEGPARTPGYSQLPRCSGVSNTSPAWSYHHGTGSRQGDAVTGGIVYTGNRYPKRYRGAYFFGDFVTQKLWTMRINASGKVVRRPENPPFASDFGAPVRFAAAPNGDIVVADMTSGNLRRIKH